MSRVLAVYGNAIMVHIHDVVPGDILSFGEPNDSDAVIVSIERDGEKVRFHYEPREGHASESLWLNPKYGPKVYIRNVKNESVEVLPPDGN